ncbi:Metallo-dependent phosphatase [Teratosphaeria nubilosa]|uniref:Metallo-dependent phosphatase n=1 Tax=Teratosphaeria nubilosa TaxID=161662 RepID=A0A6G1LJD3_9PEZI|nr:Metallo-dependent phosphatase [Teratosphaeria nubilosa]
MAASKQNRVRIVCISDTHNAAPGEGFTLPKGDILIHAGDLTNQGSHAELKKAINWIEKADFAAKIVVAGNHDLSLDRTYHVKHADGWRVEADDFDDCRKLLTGASSITYLEHSSAVIDLPEKDISLQIFGSPYSPARERKQNWAFQYSERDADGIWNAIPANLDILITHSPPAGYCDTSAHWQEGGCTSLLQHASRTRPLVHVCGHCHEGRDARIVRWNESNKECKLPDGATEVNGVSHRWEDPGAGQGNKKQSLLDLAGTRGGKVLERGRETAIVNASVMARSFGRGAKAFNKPVVVDLVLPTGPNSSQTVKQCGALHVDRSIY